MKQLTDEHWQVYYLKHKDHGNKKYSEIAKEMKVNEEYVMQLWLEMQEEHPDLFTSMTGRERDVIQFYRNFHDVVVRRKF